MQRYLHKTTLIFTLLVSFIFSQDNSKRFFITVDDLPNKYTEKILTHLVSNNYFAVLFISGPSINSNTLHYMFQHTNLFIIGNHTFSHDYNKIKDNQYFASKDVFKVHNKVLQYYQYEIKYFRAPYGLVCNNLVRPLSQLKYNIIPWDIAIENSKCFTNVKNYVDYFTNSYFNNDNNQIILLHSTYQDTLDIEMITEACLKIGSIGTRQEFENLRIGIYQ